MAYFRQLKVAYSHLEKVTKKRRSDMLFHSMQKDAESAVPNRAKAKYVFYPMPLSPRTDMSRARA